jgi:hypothetical protein
MPTHNKAPTHTGSNKVTLTGTEWVWACAAAIGKAVVQAFLFFFFVNVFLSSLF